MIMFNVQHGPKVQTLTSSQLHKLLASSGYNNVERKKIISAAIHSGHAYINEFIIERALTSAVCETVNTATMPAVPVVLPVPRQDMLPLATVDCMPTYADIPAEFKQQHNPWVKWQNTWFFAGLEVFPEVKPGIDPHAAQRQLNYIQRSFDTSHEHKEAAVAYLASLWLIEPSK